MNKFQEAVTLKEKLDRSISLQRRHPEIFKDGSVKLMVIAKMVKYPSREVLPFKAWYESDKGTVLHKLSLDEYLSTRQFSEDHVRLITNHWEQD